MVGEDFLYALHTFNARRGRTVLSLLGIVVGITSVVVVATLGSSLGASVEKLFEEDNNNIISVAPVAAHDDGVPRGQLVLTEHVRHHLKERVAGVQGFFYLNYLQASAIRRSLHAGAVSVLGVEHGWLAASGLTVSYGSDVSVIGYAVGTHSVILGKQTAEGLFPEGNAVGKTITLYVPIGRNKVLPMVVRVAAVLKEKDDFSFSSAAQVLIPRSVLTREFSRRIADAMDLKVYDSGSIAHVEDKVKSVLTNLTGNEKAFEVSSLHLIVEQMRSFLRAMNMVLTGIAAISLIVGGIGIMNIMLVTVAERRQEIGLRKALGASRMHVLHQFLVESATLTFVGGLCGVVLGLLLSVIVIAGLNAFDFQMTFSPSVVGMFIAFAGSVVIGVCFGSYPAFQAAGLDPIQSLEDR